jgi:hypothetical protein
MSGLGRLEVSGLLFISKDSALLSLVIVSVEINFKIIAST